MVKKYVFYDFLKYFLKNVTVWHAHFSSHALENLENIWYKHVQDMWLKVWSELSWEKNIWQIFSPFTKNVTVWHKSVF